MPILNPKRIALFAGLLLLCACIDPAVPQPTAVPPQQSVQLIPFPTDAEIAAGQRITEFRFRAPGLEFVALSRRDQACGLILVPGSQATRVFRTDTGSRVAIGFNMNGLRCPIRSPFADESVFYAFATEVVTLVPGERILVRVQRAFGEPPLSCVLELSTSASFCRT